MTTEEVNLRGGCSCGEIRYRLKDHPMIVHGCHCTWCQRETGSAFATNALIEADLVTLLRGNPQVVLTPSASGRGQKIARCPNCRVAVWSMYAGAGDRVYFIRVGTLDDSSQLPPDIHIYTSSKLPWITLNNDIPSVPEYYNLTEFWSKRSIERARKLWPHRFEKRSSSEKP